MAVVWVGGYLDFSQSRHWSAGKGDLEALAASGTGWHLPHTGGTWKTTGDTGDYFPEGAEQDSGPGKLRRLIVDLIEKEQRMSLSAEVKGDAYEGLLQKNAEDVKGGAGQYFTPRALIAAMVEVPAQERAWTEKLWIYDLRTNMHFTLKENPLNRGDLDDFVGSYHPKNRHERKEGGEVQGVQLPTNC